MGGKSTVPAAGRAARADGAGRVLRAGADREAEPGRSHLRARRRVRQHRARAIHVHGRDAGDGDDPPHGDESQPGDPRRDRPRHCDLRWLEPGVGGRRAPRLGRARAAEDDLRDALSRAHRSGRTPCRRGRNFHVAAREFKDEIVFLHKIVPGRSDRSYGIHVARLAGLPERRRSRARRKSCARSSRTSCSAAAGRA